MKYKEQACIIFRYAKYVLHHKSVQHSLRCTSSFILVLFFFSFLYSNLPLSTTSAGFIAVNSLLARRVLLCGEMSDIVWGRGAGEMWERPNCCYIGQSTGAAGLFLTGDHISHHCSHLEGKSHAPLLSSSNR